MEESEKPFEEPSQQSPTEDEDTMEISTEILIMMFIMLISIMGGHYIKKKQFRWIQEAELTTILGVLAGLILQILDVEIMTNLNHHFVRLFMLVLLPPIIFESGFNMHKRQFFKNIGTILMFAFFGTFIAILSTSILFYLLGKSDIMDGSFTGTEAFAFGSLISATDPVSVLAIFKLLNADANLYTIVFGESIFNDAIGIVMYRTVVEVDQMPDADFDLSEAIIFGLGEFILIFLGSLLIGIVSALVISFILKRQAMSGRTEGNVEISMMLMCPWVCYLIAEGLELSGIVSILINGIILAQYAAQNLSNESKRVLKMGYETVAYTAETLVFIFLGLGLFAFKHPFSKMGFGLFSVTILILLFARFLNVVIVSSIVNCCRKKNRLNCRIQFVLWLSGLRGAMAYALALKSTEDFGAAGEIILVVTLLYSLITIIVLGSILNPTLTKLGVKQEIEEAHDESPVIPNRSGCIFKCKRGLASFDSKYLRNFFIVRAVQDPRMEQQQHLRQPDEIGETTDEQERNHDRRSELELQPQRASENQKNVQVVEDDDLQKQ